MTKRHVAEAIGTFILMFVILNVSTGAKESCPVFAGAKETLHWPFDDPADATGSDDEKMLVFRRVRDQIRQRIGEHLHNE